MTKKKYSSSRITSDGSQMQNLNYHSKFVRRKSDTVEHVLSGVSLNVMHVHFNNNDDVFQ
jgi:hypothetical protein